MDRQSRVNIHKKQERLSIRAGNPILSEMVEGVPIIRLTKNGLFQFIKFNNVLYSTRFYRNADVSTAQATNQYHWFLYGASEEPSSAHQYYTLETIPVKYSSTDVMMGNSDDAGDGTGANIDPATTYDVSSGNTGHLLAARMHYLPYNIEILSCILRIAGDTTTDNQILKVRVCSYDIDETAGAPGGDLSNGKVLITSSNLDNDGSEQMYIYKTESGGDLSISRSKASAGKALLAFLSISGTADYTLDLQINYRII